MEESIGNSIFQVLVVLVGRSVLQDHSKDNILRKQETWLPSVNKILLTVRFGTEIVVVMAALWTMHSYILKSMALIRRKVIPTLQCKAYSAGIVVLPLAQHAQV